MQLIEQKVSAGDRPIFDLDEFLSRPLYAHLAHSSAGEPRESPVWFHWDGETVMIFSQVHAAKLRHIARNSHVALNFNTDEDGGDVGVLLGEARILQGALDARRMSALAGPCLA